MSIYELYLKDALGSVANARAEDPYLTGARSVASWQMQPQTSAEAIWGPAVQGLLAGFLAGQGKKNVNETVFNKIASSNLIKALNPLGVGVSGPLTEAQSLAGGDIARQYGGAMPEGWTAESGISDLMLQLAQKEQQDQQAIDKYKAQEDLKNSLMIEGVKTEQISLEDAFKMADGKPFTKATEEAPISPEFDEIKKVIPKEYRAEALKELGTQTTINRVFGSIDSLLDEGVKLAKDPTSSLPATMYGVPLPQSESKIKRSTLAGQIASMILPVWKGPLDEKDAVRILDPFLPSYYDKPSTIAEKKKGLKNLILNNLKDTPILDTFGLSKKPIIESAKTVDTPPTPPDGYELTGNRNANGDWGMRKIR